MISSSANTIPQILADYVLCQLRKALSNMSFAIWIDQVIDSEKKNQENFPKKW